MPVEVEGASEPGLEVDVQRMLDALGWSRSHVSVMLVDDGAIQALNEQWRGKATPTDVLSFPQLAFVAPDMPAAGQTFEGVPTTLGDVVVSLETARSQAEVAGHGVQVELRVLIAHGLCHLLGYDHSDPDDARAMAGRERHALAACSVGASSLVGRAGR